MQVPGSMDSVLTTKTFVSNIGSDGSKFWRNPALDSEPVESKAEVKIVFCLLMLNHLINCLAFYSSFWQTAEA